jgi:Tn3 transposase DDE domain
VYDGGVHIGRLFRTDFPIDYLTNSIFRSELQHVLNRGEAVHTVQRAIHIGKIPSELTKHHGSLAAVSSSLALLTNAVMAWNTMHMQRAVGQIEALSGDVLRAVDLRQIAPPYLGGINLRGKFDFPIVRYADRVLPSLVDGLSGNELGSA